MIIGVIADTHIPNRAEDIPREILENFKHVDMVIHAGDLEDPKVLDRLRSACKDVRAVYGNMDPAEVREKIPEKEIISVGNYRIGVMHGYGPPDKLISLLKDIFKDDRVDIIIFGHSHKGCNEKIGQTLYFNPGSATDKIFASQNSYGIIEINDEIKARIIKI